MPIVTGGRPRPHRRAPQALDSNPTANNIAAMQPGFPPKPPSGPKPGELSYRAYFLNGGRRIVSSHEFFAASDEEAIKVAEAWREGRNMELWQRARIVK